ncbi:MAG: hypothetical protein PSN04_06005 [Methyloprofundus sp.]|nr:hypothetical protein [Methyloprofundus sp.]
MMTGVVSAASLTVSADASFYNDGLSGGGQIINNGSDAVHVNSGTLDQEFSHAFTVENTGAAGVFRLWVDGTASSSTFIESFSVLVDGIEIAALTAPTYTAGTFANILLAAGDSILMVVSGDFNVASYGLTLQTPVPAAVWLFGSALMGLFGASRRKSSAMAA